MRTIHAKPDLVEQVRQAILDAIISGEWAAGDRITQEEIASQLGVSRQPVLQALLLMREQGLVIDPPNRRGVLVPELTSQFLTDLYQVRSALDSTAAGAAARNGGVIRRNKGQDLIKRGEDAVVSRDVRQMVRADQEFHAAIYEASGNQILIDAAMRHWPHTQRAMSEHLRQPNTLFVVWKEHQDILNAIAVGDARLAERLSRQHCEKSLKQILSNHPSQPAAASRSSKPRRRA